MIVRGTTETRDELTGNFGSALEDASISDYRLIALFAEKTLNAIFGVLQHYPPITGHSRRPSACLKSANNRSAGRFAGNLFPRVRLGTSNLNSFCQLL
jgi:hypothetical protein